MFVSGRGLYPRAGRCQILLLLLVCGLILAHLSGCSGNREAQRREAEAAYQLGLAFLTENRPTPALRELTKSVQRDPTNPEVYLALGLAYWRKQEFTEAEKAFRTAVELKPDYSEAWNNLGALYLDQERYEAAVPALEEAVGNVFYETPELALANLGWALHNVGRSTEGERRLRESIEIAGNFPLAHKFLALVLEDRGELEQALYHIDQALRFLPNDAESHLKRGMMLLELGRREEARGAFQRAWQLSPGTELGRNAKAYMELME